MPSSHDSAYRQVKNAILSFALEPGEVLNTSEIAAKLKVSRTPVREALNRLQQEGLVRRKGEWGYCVSSMDPSELSSLYRVRELLEVEAVQQAVAKLKASDHRKMEMLLRKATALLRGKQYVRFLSVSREFHKAIAHASGNPILQEILARLTDRVQISGLLLIQRYPYRADEILQANRRLLDALRGRSRSAVAKVMRWHVRRGEHAMKEAFSESRRGMKERVHGRR